MHIESLLLGAAVTFAIVSGAHATDAVVLDDQPNLLARDNVSACDAYGSGFAKLPGTDTCVRISGQLRFEGRVSNTSRPAIGGRSSITFETRGDPW